MMDLFMMAVSWIGDRVLTDEVLAEAVEFLSKATGASQEELEPVRKRLEATIGVSMTVGEGINDGENTPWVEDIKASTEWRYWDSYIKQLKSEGFPAPVIRTLDEDTDNILTECGNPSNDKAWRIQGLVMGDVQSGKTASYTGLISKAADCGYRVIVLLTGMIEDLRAQTQERLDQGLVGRDSRQLLKGEIDNTRIGSGRFRGCTPNVLTSIDSDFLTANRKALRGIPLVNIKEPVLLVMKKNKAALSNLLSFLGTQLPKGAERLHLPLMLVDDEADNASVNSRKDEDPTTINRLIRELLGKFDQATYVAYTATPFANVFINPEGNDLFPSNFVYGIEAPSNYIGTGGMFSDDGDYADQLVDIDDAAETFPEKHKKTLGVDSMPQSLEDAIGVFLISCAIRDLRQEVLRHRSMLVNVTRFSDVQTDLSNVIRSHLYEQVQEIKQYLADDESWMRHAFLVRLKDLFDLHYASCGVSWNQARTQLYDSVASVKVVTINQRTDRSERLNYRQYRGLEKGRRVIAVGGLSLSRGLTLEGLCISYFYRSSKAYDTLLQMGRWFGYRFGYDDLCRVWMSPDAQDWFAHIADVVAELRGDLRRMHAAHQPPRRFGIRVRSHPGALLVTAANKMRNAEEVEIDISFSGCGVETPYLPKSVVANRANAKATSSFLTSLGPAEPKGSRYAWYGVDAKQVADFLQQLQISPMNPAFIPDLKTDEEPLIFFIRENGVEALDEWDVCIASGKGESAEGIEFKGGDGDPITVSKSQRQFEKSPLYPVDYLKVNRHRVGQSSDEKVGMTRDLIDQAEKKWIAEDESRVGKTTPGGAYRRMRERPLITIYAIEPVDPKAKDRQRMLEASSIEPKLLVAVSLSFPEFKETSETSVPYRLNKVYLQNLGLLGDEYGVEDQD